MHIIIRRLLLLSIAILAVILCCHDIGSFALVNYCQAASNPETELLIFGKDFKTGQQKQHQHVSMIGADEKKTGKSNIKMIAIGSSHLILISREYRAYTLGWNSDGQLGRGDVCSTDCVFSDWAAIPGDYVAAAAGSYHSLLLDTEGVIHAFGYNMEGQLGIHRSQEMYNYPVRVTDEGISEKQIVAIAAGDAHSLALDSVGHVYSCGDNNLGQLGRYSGDNRVFQRVFGALRDKKIIAISSGADHSFAIDDQGHLYAWGDNSHSQLGIPLLTDSNRVKVDVPIRVTEGVIRDLKIVQAESGLLFSLVLDDQGNVYASGSNMANQLGIPSVNSTSVFTRVKFSHNESEVRIVRIAAGESHSIAVDDKGNIYGWGYNFYSQIDPLGHKSRNNIAQPTLLSSGDIRVAKVDDDLLIFAGFHVTAAVVSRIQQSNIKDEL